MLLQERCSVVFQRWPNFDPLVAKKWLKMSQNGGFEFKLGVYTYWVSECSELISFFWSRWPKFGPLVATKWLKLVVSDHYLKKVFTHSNSNLVCTLIKSPPGGSPRSGVTCMFSVGFRRRKKLFPFTSKPFELNLWYLAQRIYGSVEMYWMTFPWPWPKVMAVASISTNLLVCARKWEPIIRSLQNMAALLS